MLNNQFCQLGREYFAELAQKSKLEISPIVALREQRFDRASLNKWQHNLQPLQALLEHLQFAALSRPLFHKIDEGICFFGKREDLDDEAMQLLQAYLQAMMPWKKGPFNFFGTYIDAEWRSDWKWQRLKPHLHLKSKRVADVGCNNGYYMWQALQEQPDLVVGFEPTIKHALAFALTETLVPSRHLLFEPLGAEHLHWYPQFFDTILMLGILYHHTDPISLLRKSRSALAPGGEIIIDCQGIAGEESNALMPKGRYAGASGIWWLPTLPVLKTWLNRSGFRNIEVIYAAPLESTEQRSTAWAPIASLAEHLSQDGGATIEGYPPPWRFYLKALR